MSSKCLQLSITIITILAALGGLARAQGTRADYKRAAELGGMTNDTVFKTNVKPHWFDDGQRFWYRNDLRDRKREFILVDAAKGLRKPAFDHAKVAAGLSAASKRKCSPDKLPIDL
ncbi:MAG: S9 family peptidase, partial [Phycisphaerae bacterium]|nr:S9 family peptidase [Phycisphaerae bacterium]